MAKALRGKTTRGGNAVNPLQGQVLLIEPYFTGSHASWARHLQQQHPGQFELLTLSGSHWKWRMHGGAVTLAQRFLESDLRPDQLLVTSMLDLSVFLGLTREQTAGIPTVLYFHENQLTYPWSERDTDKVARRDNHYAFINYTSALAADRVFFNSFYHRDAFLEALGPFLSAFPDHKEVANVERIRAKSEVWYPVPDFSTLDLDEPVEKGKVPLILWNHRWEYDKDPQSFFEVLYQLADEGVAFEVAVLGERFPQSPAVFDEARDRLGDRVVQFGRVESRIEYARWLHRADVLPVTSRQDFYGISLVEAMHCGVFPLCPDRLVFPEHFSPEDARNHIYHNREDLVNRLRTFLKGA